MASAINRVCLRFVIKSAIVKEEQISVGITIGKRASMGAEIMHRSWTCIISIENLRIREQNGLVRVKDILDDIIIIGNREDGVIVGTGDTETRGTTV